MYILLPNYTFVPVFFVTQAEPMTVQLRKLKRRISYLIFFMRSNCASRRKAVFPHWLAFFSTSPCDIQHLSPLQKKSFSAARRLYANYLCTRGQAFYIDVKFPRVYLKNQMKISQQVCNLKFLLGAKLVLNLLTW